VITVQPEEKGTRLDTFLAHHLERTSRAAVQRWIQAGHVTVDGVSRKASYQLSGSETIELIAVPSQVSKLAPEPIPINILYEDEDLVVVNKQAGIVVHPGAGNWSGTLANALLHHFGNLFPGDALRPGIVHRLDKETSGVLVVAKNEYAHESLSRQFKLREVEKHYLALVHGCLQQSSGKIEVAIGRDPRSRTRISTRSKKPRKAVTLYEVLRRWPHFTYVRAFPHTGRTHQIRVHFHHIGHPVVGDKTYGGKRLNQAIKNLNRHFLHATFLRFKHPTSGKQVEFEAALPNELEEMLSTLEK